MSPPFLITPSEVLNSELNKRVRRVLGSNYHNMSIDRLTLSENLLDEVSEVSFSLKVGDDITEIYGSGKGIVDALFSGMLRAMGEEYVSLRELSLLDFSVEGDFENKKYKQRNTDANVEVRLLVQSSNISFIFRERSASINTAAIKAVLKLVEHFINSERAVEIIYNCIKDARKRERGDLADEYLRELAELVRSISYEKKIKDLL